MGRLKQRDRKVYGEIQKFFRRLEADAGLGYDLRGEWEGWRAIHLCSDRYRVIWQDRPEIDDFEGADGDTVVPVVVIRVGPKNQPAGGTVYDAPPSEASPDR
jgi:hypothetical protein